MMTFTSHARTSVVCEPGALGRLGELARGNGFAHTLLVADPGMVKAGLVDRAVRALEAAGVAVTPWHGFGENPDTDAAEAGRVFAADLHLDSVIGLGGGSSLDAAKAVNFLLTNGGTMHDYRGYGKAKSPLLPMIAIPTTTGTGSEAQSYAVISDAQTHRKMACGDPTAAAKVAVLDAELAAGQPKAVLAASAFDAVSHAVETWVCSKANAMSDCFAREAWRLLNENFERALIGGGVEVAGRMQVASYFAGAAIEHSMLGAAHACANPLTQRYGTTHGHALAMLLPHVVRWNTPSVNGRYADLHPELPLRLEEMRSVAGLPRALGEAGVELDALADLSERAAEQWTGTFNPRKLDAASAMELYLCAY
ncbi:MAG TPA: iron-containing alcohol dehydrogenase [Bryobacteraceae bacterium]|jgi:alcohol dehydrogenase class IV|nr:iron-containing alcohol dehydrogenase [Bryobacteraceae bacterium]